MAGASKEKKQQSLTSFFTPKSVNGLNAHVQRTLSQSSPASDGNENKDKETPTGSKKRPLQRNTDDGNETPTKRSKNDEDNDKSAFFSKSPQKSPVVTKTDAGPIARTQRYLYNGSSQDGAALEAVAENEDAVEKRRKADLHQKFVKKLGKPDSMAQLRRRNFSAEDETQGGEGEDADDVEDDEPPPPPKGKKKGAKTGKLTPMEIQFLDIKRKNMDTLLVMEVGYKFRFFGEDARIAAKELSIVCIPGKFRYDEHPSEAHLDRFASASIPVHRLPVHVKRLVAAGHKVGVVRQIETAALKKAGDNRNAPFVRKLTNVYTKGTYVDEIGELEQQSDSGAPAAGYLLCITESKAKGWGTDEKVDVGIIAVQPATGDIIYDNFEDGFMRNEIETRLLHISPCEFLIVGELTKATDKLVQHLSGSSTNVFGDRSRVERISKSKTIAAEAYSHVTQFYAGKLKENAAGNEHASALLDKVLKLPEPVTICLSSMINHLKDYGLEHIFDLTKYFTSFSARSHMLVNGTTLESLEVYRNQTDHVEKGSLFWALDKTQTRFGQRLLRKWIGRPLLDQARLEERVAAVEELLAKASTPSVDQLENLLINTKTDLERSLIRIYYGKCSRPELLASLQALQKISTEFSRVKSAADSGFDSSAISGAVLSLPQILPMVLSYLERINAEAARKDDKYAFFRENEETEDITDHKLGIASVEQELDAHRKVAAQKLNKKTPVTYVTVAGIEYLIEVSNTDLKHVPASWVKISGTKKLSRFHTPEVVRLITERDQHKESLAAACDAAFAELLASIASDYQPLRDAVSALATLDCLLSLSKVAALPGYSKPVFLPADSAPTVTITSGRHPIAEHTLMTSYIPFTTTLSSAPQTSSDSPVSPAQLITGPNMGGKSSYVRAVALLVLMAQIGSFVPAEAMSLTPCDGIYTRMGASDNIFSHESTFMVEVNETAQILRSATPRSLVILDELGRGTSTHDGAAIAQAVLQHVAEDIGCLTLFITHYQNLSLVADGIKGGKVRNMHMRFTATRRGEIANDADDWDGDEEITFLYEVGEGVAHRSYGLNVARLARIPGKVLDVAAKRSRELEEEIKGRRLNGTAKLLMDVLDTGVDQLDHLISSIEQL
ncbi:DNA mismatch repair protein MSH3 [Pestalotiopsis fici W106-1]|uniref:DNA mismatch repair protein n=1 Tax=Pestalotiopsis fici (strain W106-1 / CGMCC3.15140) TaxID=1229662 RepID=W3XMG8_PESFW|nr:DNA mismatch repair protein MSH3 [Pestalotiopsis fici W106-1]ETS87189.1 DNA mismatch repair protein MSH3 [Pestalotiopsis fici W106-1]